VQLDIIHSLIKAIIQSDKLKTEVSEAQFSLPKEAIRVLYNAASLDCVKHTPYIPGLTSEQDQCRNKINQWGGLACLRHVLRSTQPREVLEFCDSIKLQQRFLNSDIEALLSVLKRYMDLDPHLSPSNPNATVAPQVEPHTIHADLAKGQTQTVDLPRVGEGEHTPTIAGQSVQTQGGSNVPMIASHARLLVNAPTNPKHRQSQGLATQGNKKLRKEQEKEKEGMGGGVAQAMFPE
jgi:hypothetical protein